MTHTTLKKLLLPMWAIALFVTPSFMQAKSEAVPAESAAAQMLEGPKGGQQKPGEQNFAISDEELKMLNLNQQEEQELKEFFKALNELTPDQKRELEELGRQTEERMRQQNLDPTNLDDMMKFMEAEGLVDQQQKPPAQKPQAPAPQPKSVPAKQAPKPTPIQKPQLADAMPALSPQDAQSLLKGIVDLLSSLQQKASTRPGMLSKLRPLDDQVLQLKFYLNLIHGKVMIESLTSKEFAPLYGALERLYKALISFEPSITAATMQAESPYDVLDLPYSAGLEEIEERFDEFKRNFGPENIENYGYSKQIIKQAERRYPMIEKAYNELKDPQRRAALDERLEEERAKEARRQTISMRSFDRLFRALQSAFSEDRILTEVHQFLEKYKPKELAQMKANLELERKALERSRQEAMIPQKRPDRDRRSMESREYKEFYDTVRKQKAPRMPSSRQSGGPLQGRSKPGGGKAPAKKGPDKGKPADAKKPGEAGKKGTGDKKDGKKQDGPSSGTKGAPAGPTKGPAGELSKKDIEQKSAMFELEKLLKDTSEKDFKAKVKDKDTRSGAEVEQELSLDQILGRLESELKADGPVDPDAVKHLVSYFEQHKLNEILSKVKKAAPPEGKPLNPFITDEWVQTLRPHESLFKKWHDVARRLDPGLRTEMGAQFRDKNNINKNKRKPYGIDLKDIPPYTYGDDEKKALSERTKPSGPDLGMIRSKINELVTYLSKTRAK